MNLLENKIKNNTNIIWKHVSITTIAPDGVQLEGELTYWAKDYNVCLLKPFTADGGGAHLMYAIPAVYATTEPPRNGVKYIHLFERAKEMLRIAYENKDTKLKEYK